MGNNNYNARRVYYERRRKRRRKIILKRLMIFLLFIILLGGLTFGIVKISNSLKMRGKFNSNGNQIGKGNESSNSELIKKLKEIKIPKEIDEQIIDVHNTARLGTELDDVKNIVIHYVGNPGTTAKNNRDYYNKPSTEVSSHFVVGLDGEIIQCVPLWERSSASNWRNNDTISIEVCHPDKTGKFNIDTYSSLVKLTAWLLNEVGLDKNAVIRHYDITGKECPKYYAQNADAWETFKKDVGKKSDVYKK